MLRLPVDVEVEFDTVVFVTVGFLGSFEIEHTEVVAALRDERGTLHLRKTNGNFIEIPPGYLYFEVSKEGKNDD